MDPAFLLTKWYLDCVSEAGDAAIVYAAELRWHGITARYTSVLSRVGMKLKTRAAVLGCELPRRSADTISFHNGPLSMQGTWEADSPAVSRTIFETEGRGVYWNCLQPRSWVKLQLGDTYLGGFGYAECLTLTLPPWQLPLCKLRWGRFLAEQDALTWIDWQGEAATTFAIHNGIEHVPHEVSESRLCLSGATLELQEGARLRGGELRKTLLPDLPVLATLLPESFLGVREEKWLSRATLRASGHGSAGWAIHEVVHWKR